MDFQQYIKPELLILIPVLYLLGMWIKNSAIADRHIPWILGLCGIIFSAMYIFASDSIIGAQAILTAIFTAITQGILLAGASVYANQLVKQSGASK